VAEWLGAGLQIVCS